MTIRQESGVRLHFVLLVKIYVLSYHTIFHFPLSICDALYDLVRFKKRERHPQRRATFNRVAGLRCRLQSATLLKVTLFEGCFSCFLDCINCTKSHKASHIRMFERPISKHVITENALSQ